MAQGGALRWGTLFHTPGNPQLPVLPAPSDPITGDLRAYGDIASVRFGGGVPTLLVVNGALPGVAGGYLKTYLNGIGGQPNPLEFGNITGVNTKVVTAFNTYRDSRTITAIDLSGASGVTLVSPGLPVDVPPFGSIVFTFEASTVGDPTIDAIVKFTHDLGSFDIRFTGRRIIIFETLPQRPISEKISWVTDRMISVDGTEQVMEIRQLPRSEIKIVQRFTNQVERTRQLNLINASGFLRVGVQLWFEAREISQAAAAIDTVIQISTLNMEIDVNQEVMFVTPAGVTSEAITVTAFDPTSITLAKAIGIELELGSQGMPIKYGFLRAKGATNTFAINAEDLSLSFNIIEYSDIAALDLAYFDEHPVDNLPIVTAPAFFDGSNRAGSITQALDVLDGKTGDIQTRRDEPLARPRLPVLVYCESLADQFAWRSFLHYIRGSWRAFYIPTDFDDLPLGLDLTLGGNTLSVVNTGLSKVTNLTPRRDLKIVVQGVVYYRRVNSVVDAGPTETITLSDTIPGAGSVPIADVKVSWLYQVRLEGDTATFRHLRAGQSELRFLASGVIS
jgi:hypothetical protein